MNCRELINTKIYYLTALGLIMELSFNSIMPLFYEQVADKIDVRIAYAVLIPCYYYLVFILCTATRSEDEKGNEFPFQYL